MAFCDVTSTLQDPMFLCYSLHIWSCSSSGLGPLSCVLSGVSRSESWKKLFHTEMKYVYLLSGWSLAILLMFCAHSAEEVFSDDFNDGYVFMVVGVISVMFIFIFLAS